MKKIFAVMSVLCLLSEISLAQGLYSSPLGVQAYTFRRSMPFTPEKTLDTIKMMGFTEIEASPGKLTPEALKKLCNDRGITIPSTGADYNQLVKSPDSVVIVAKALGASFVMCAWIPHGATFTIEDAKKAVADFNKAGKYLKENGITLCYHTHGYEFYPYEDGTLMDYMIKNTNPEYVSFEMDILWVQFGGGDPVALLKKYGDRWKLMHLKDLKKGTPKNLSGGTSQDNDVVLGTGEIDIPAILREAKRVGIKHYFIEDESNNVNGQVPASIKYLRSLK